MIPTLSKSERRNPVLADGRNKSIPSGSKAYAELSSTHYGDYSMSVVEYLDLRKRRLSKYIHPSKNPRALVELGDIHLKKNDLKRAREAYRNAIKLDAKMVEAYKKLLGVLIAVGDTHAADYYFQCLVEVTDEHVDYKNDYLMFKLALSNGDDVKIKKVYSELEELLALNPSHSDLLNNLGIYHILYSNNLEDAKRYLMRSLEADHKNIHALNNLGICYQREKNFDKADEYYNKAMVLSDKFSPIYENMASSLVDRKMLDKALNILEKGKSLNLQYSEIWEHNIGWLMLLLHRFEEARDWYLNRISIEPQNSLLYNNLGVCFEGLIDIKSALKNYKRAAELYATIGAAENDKRYHNGFYNLMRILQAEGEFSTLEPVAKMLLKLSPGNLLATYYLGSARIYLKRYMSAKELLEEVVSRDKTLRNAHVDLSFLLDSITHEYKLAIDLLEGFINRNGIVEERIANNLAFAYIKDGQISKAKAILRNDAFQTPITIATRGLLEYYGGDYEQGNKYYSEAIEAAGERGKVDAEQTWKYEQAAYWYRKKDYSMSEKFIKDAIKLGKDSFLYADIVELENKLKALPDQTSL